MNRNEFTATRALARRRREERAKDDYIRLVKKLRSTPLARVDGATALSEDDQIALATAAEFLGLPDHHDLQRDVDAIGMVEQYAQELAAAEAAVASMPQRSEITQHIADCDETIRDTMQRVLLPAKREALRQLEERDAKDTALRAVRDNLARVRHEHPHLFN